MQHGKQAYRISITFSPSDNVTLNKECNRGKISDICLSEKQLMLFHSIYSTKIHIDDQNKHCICNLFCNCNIEKVTVFESMADMYSYSKMYGRKYNGMH